MIVYYQSIFGSCNCSIEHFQLHAEASILVDVNLLELVLISLNLLNLHLVPVKFLGKQAYDIFISFFMLGDLFKELFFLIGDFHYLQSLEKTPLTEKACISVKEVKQNNIFKLKPLRL